MGGGEGRGKGEKREREKQGYKFRVYMQGKGHTIYGVVTEVQCFEHDKTGKGTQLRDAVCGHNVMQHSKTPYPGPMTDNENALIQNATLFAVKNLPKAHHQMDVFKLGSNTVHAHYQHAHRKLQLLQ